MKKEKKEPKEKQEKTEDAEKKKEDGKKISLTTTPKDQLRQIASLTIKDKDKESD